jgi:hypothetical protein
LSARLAAVLRAELERAREPEARAPAELAVRPLLDEPAELERLFVDRVERLAPLRDPVRLGCVIWPRLAFCRGIPPAAI